MLIHKNVRYSYGYYIEAVTKKNSFTATRTTPAVRRER